MSTENHDKTMPLTEQLVRDAWYEFIADAPSLATVPAFLGWLRGNESELLEVVSKAALVKVANGLVDTDAAPGQSEVEAVAE